MDEDEFTEIVQQFIHCCYAFIFNKLLNLKKMREMITFLRLQKQIPKILAKVAVAIGLETNSINKKENIVLTSIITECNWDVQQLDSRSSIWK